MPKPPSSAPFRHTRLPSLALYNALPNVLWSLLSFVPVSVFCFQFMERRWLYSFICIALLAYLLPAKQLRRLEPASSLAFYRRLGVRWANNLTQHGTLINRVVRKRDSRYRRFRTRADAIRLLRATYGNERFHWATLLFFLLSALFAAIHHHLAWALLITLINVFYNLYPIWLQQYMRIRLERYLARSAPDNHPR